MTIFVPSGSVPFALVCLQMPRKRAATVSPHGTRSAKQVKQHATPSPKPSHISPTVMGSPEFQLAVNAAVQAAIPAIVLEIQKGVPSNSETMQEEALMLDEAVHDHIEQVAGEVSHTMTPETVGHPDSDLGIPVDHHLSDKQRTAIVAHHYIEFKTLLKKMINLPGQYH